MILVLAVGLATAGCAGLTAREKGPLGGVLGGYLLGDRIFRDDPGRTK